MGSGAYLAAEHSPDNDGGQISGLAKALFSIERKFSAYNLSTEERDFLSTSSFADFQLCFSARIDQSVCWKADTPCRGSRYQNRKVRTKYMSIYLYKFLYMCLHAHKL